MWYVSGLRWPVIDGRQEPVYAVKYSSSADGVNWERPNLLCIPQAYDNEAISHPSVVKYDGKYLMWYSYRDSTDFRDGKGAYRIGFADSLDGLSWSRNDQLQGLDVAAEGWDS
jgi:hypothetical protein